MYSCHYIYKVNDEKELELKNQACFGDLFRNISKQSIIDNISVSVFMYNHDGSDHNFKFKVEDVIFVFNKLSHIIAMPEVIQVNSYTVCVKFTFEKVTRGFIRTTLTILRYFFECKSDEYKKTYNTEHKRDFEVIMRESITFCKENPEASFIEVFQFMHYNTDLDTGHSLLDIYGNDYPEVILSDATFNKHMNDPERVRIQGQIFSGFNFKFDSLMSKKKYLNSFNQIARI